MEETTCKLETMYQCNDTQAIGMGSSLIVKSMLVFSCKQVLQVHQSFVIAMLGSTATHQGLHDSAPRLEQCTAMLHTDGCDRA